MGSLIRSPKLSGPRVLHTPRRAAPTVADDALAGKADPATAAAMADPAADPERDAHVAAAELRAETAEAEARAARQELETLKSELAQLREQARTEGVEEGREIGLERSQAEQRERVEQGVALLETLRARTQERLSLEEDAIAEAVWVSVGKLLVPALSTREGVAAAVRSVCQQISGRDPLIVRVSPGDHALLSSDPELLAPLSERVRLEPDASVELGGCIVESTGGTLDGRLEVQLEGLHRVLLRARRELPSEEEAS